MARDAHGGSGVNANEGFAMSFAPRCEVTTRLDGGAGAAILLGALAIVMGGIATTIISVAALRARTPETRHIAIHLEPPTSDA